MVDTNIFSGLAQGMYPVSALPTDGTLAATHVQRDEIDQTGDRALCARIAASFRSTVPELSLTNSFVVGSSRVGEAKISDGVGYRRILAHLESIQRMKKRKSPRSKKKILANIRDTQIAETALANGHYLLTGDVDLAEAMEASGGKAILMIRPASPPLSRLAPRGSALLYLPVLH